jgi:hypothetical protein
MKEPTVVTPITPEEWELVCLLRDIPWGRSRGQLLALMRELVTFVASPSCSEAQADGVPCPTAHASCDECQHIHSCLARMRDLVGASEASDLA